MWMKYFHLYSDHTSLTPTWCLFWLRIPVWLFLGLSLLHVEPQNENWTQSWTLSTALFINLTACISALELPSVVGGRINTHLTDGEQKQKLLSIHDDKCVIRSRNREAVCCSFRWSRSREEFWSAGLSRTTKNPKNTPRGNPCRKPADRFSSVLHCHHVVML